MAIRTRIGFYTLNKTALVLCKALARFSPYIIQQYPDNAALLAALAAAQSACAVLRSAIAPYTVPEIDDPSA